MEQQSPSRPVSPESELAALKAAVADLQNRIATLERGTLPVQPQNPAGRRELAESRLGLTVVNRVGAVTLAIGIIFFFKYAADNHWIGAGGLVLVGVLAGLVLIGGGEWLRRRNDQAFAQGVAGCGLVILYASVYAAFGYYHLLSRQLGFAGLVLVSAGALVLSFRFVSPAIAAVGFVGGFVAPLLARKQPDTNFTWLYFVYVLLLSVVSVQVIRRLFRVSERLPVLLLVPFTAFWAVLTAQLLVGRRFPREFVLLTLAVGAIYAIAAWAAREISKLFAYLYLSAHVCVVIAGLRAIDIWSSSEGLESTLDSVLLGVYGVFAIVAGLLRRSIVDRWLGLSLLAAVVIKLYIYDVWQLTRSYVIGAFVALGVLLLAASYLYSRFKSRTDTISR